MTFFAVRGREPTQQSVRRDCYFLTDRVVDTIISVTRTGDIGDGKIFIVRITRNPASLLRHALTGLRYIFGRD